MIDYSDRLNEQNSNYESQIRRFNPLAGTPVETPDPPYET